MCGTESYLDSYIIDMKNAFDELLSNHEVIQEVIAYEQYKIYNPPISDDIEF
jgi:hypothetical protein